MSTTLPYRTGSVRNYVFPLLAMGTVVLLPSPALIMTMVIVGHAHFLMAYLYQVKGKKISQIYLLTALLLFCIGVTCVLLQVPLLPLLVVAGIIFSAHFALDEFTLHGEALSTASFLSIASFALLFSSIIIWLAFPGLLILSLCAGLGVTGVIVVRALRNKVPVSETERYLWLIGIILFFLAVIMEMPEKILAVIVLLHFANWYVGYGNRLTPVPERARLYWIETIITLGISILLYVLFTVFHVEALELLFGLTYFYLWTAAHIVLSFVTTTYRLAGP